MKRIVLAAAVAAAAALGSISAANAVVIGAGPNGVYVGEGYHHHRHHWDRDYASCRTVVTTRWHHGHRVTVRRRFCD